jgi:hypothetical protein
VLLTKNGTLENVKCVYRFACSCLSVLRGSHPYNGSDGVLRWTGCVKRTRELKNAHILAGQCEWSVPLAGGGGCERVQQIKWILKKWGLVWSHLAWGRVLMAGFCKHCNDFCYHKRRGIWTSRVPRITQMLEAAGASETSVNLYQTTRRNVSEDSHFHTRRRENLKSRSSSLMWTVYF